MKKKNYKYQILKKGLILIYTAECGHCPVGVNNNHSGLKQPIYLKSINLYVYMYQYIYLVVPGV
jgi:hypothetical protein